uniref:Uncharacterized protein n=1 Tax=Rhizophora mucronata TaxID=61149 RepID=A0A2P2NPG9_RHIMU
MKLKHIKGITYHFTIKPKTLIQEGNHKRQRGDKCLFDSK